MRISDWSSDVCSSDLAPDNMVSKEMEAELLQHVGAYMVALTKPGAGKLMLMVAAPEGLDATYDLREASRSEEHTSELQSLMRISYAVFCLKKKKSNKKINKLRRQP